MLVCQRGLLVVAGCTLVIVKCIALRSCCFYKFSHKRNLFGRYVEGRSEILLFMGKEVHF